MKTVSKLPWVEKLKLVLFGIVFVYIMIGVASVLYMVLLERINCLSQSGVFGLWCDTGGGLSAAIAIIAWPAFWF